MQSLWLIFEKKCIIYRNLLIHKYIEIAAIMHAFSMLDFTFKSISILDVTIYIFSGLKCGMQECLSRNS